MCARACEMFNFILHRLYFVLIYFILIYVIFVFYFMLFLLFLITFVLVVFSSWYYFFILLQCISIVFYLFILLEFNLVALDLLTIAITSYRATRVTSFVCDRSWRRVRHGVGTCRVTKRRRR